MSIRERAHTDQASHLEAWMLIRLTLLPRFLVSSVTTSLYKVSVSQVETVGTGIMERKEVLLEALEELRGENDYIFSALMVTDIIEGGTELLCAGDCVPVERAFDSRAKNGVIDLPGVMSRKKQVAPKLLAVL